MNHIDWIKKLLADDTSGAAPISGKGTATDPYTTKPAAKGYDAEGRGRYEADIIAKDGTIKTMVFNSIDEIMDYISDMVDTGGNTPVTSRKTDEKSAKTAALEIVLGELCIAKDKHGDLSSQPNIDKGQMLLAAAAHIGYIRNKRLGNWSDKAYLDGMRARFWPADWGRSGMRDYGSEVAGLAVAAGFILNEIARLIMNGESTYRAPRGARPIGGPLTQNSPLGDHY